MWNNGIFFFQTGQPFRGIGTNQVLDPPSHPSPPERVVKSISNNERGKTLKITFNLEEPSPKTTICFEIKVAYIHCNALTPFAC